MSNIKKLVVQLIEDYIKGHYLNGKNLPFRWCSKDGVKLCKDSDGLMNVKTSDGHKYTINHCEGYVIHEADGVHDVCDIALHGLRNEFEVICALFSNEEGFSELWVNLLIKFIDPKFNGKFTDGVDFSESVERIYRYFEDDVEIDYSNIFSNASYYDYFKICDLYCIRRTNIGFAMESVKQRRYYLLCNHETLEGANIKVKELAHMKYSLGCDYGISGYVLMDAYNSNILLHNSFNYGIYYLNDSSNYHFTKAYSCDGYGAYSSIIAPDIGNIGNRKVRSIGPVTSLPDIQLVKSNKCYNAYGYNSVKHNNKVVALFTVYKDSTHSENESTGMRKEDLKTGMLVKHFKHEKDKENFEQHVYEILGLATHTETEEELVIYRSFKNHNNVYARPLSMFLQKVDKIKYPDIKQEYRFEVYLDVCHD